MLNSLTKISYFLRGKLNDLDEAVDHMNEANSRFDKVMASDDASEAQNVPDMYLEPIRYLPRF